MTTDELLLMAYADGALNREAQRMLRRRLASDEALRLQLAGLQRTTQLARLALDGCDMAMPSARSKVVLLTQCPRHVSHGSRIATAPLALASTALAIAAGALLLWTLLQSEVRHTGDANLPEGVQLAETAVLRGGRMS